MKLFAAERHTKHIPTLVIPFQLKNSYQDTFNINTQQKNIVWNTNWPSASKSWTKNHHSSWSTRFTWVTPNQMSIQYKSESPFFTLVNSQPHLWIGKNSQPNISWRSGMLSSLKYRNVFLFYLKHQICHLFLLKSQDAYYIHIRNKLLRWWYT